MPAHFAILRTAKLKSFGNVGGSLSHTYRTRETTNADPDRADTNEHSHSSPAEVMQALRDRLPDKYRKDAVIGLEYFVGASPQWFDGKTREQQDTYFYESIEWLQQRHGKENVVGWSPPTIEQAKLAVSERRRADEMTRTARGLERDKKALTERLKGFQDHLAPVLELATLSKQEYAQLVRHAQERVNAIKAERERDVEKFRTDHERNRRIDDLVRVERTSSGPAHTFAQHALRAIGKAGGDMSKVEWKEVEATASRESIIEHNQDPKKVLAAIIKHSPGMVDPVRQEKAQKFISNRIGKEISSPKLSR